MPAYPLGRRRNRLPDWRIRFAGRPPANRQARIKTVPRTNKPVHELSRDRQPRNRQPNFLRTQRHRFPSPRRVPRLYGTARKTPNTNKIKHTMSYYDTILRYDWETTRRAIYAKNDADVERALAAERPTMDDFAALVSPAADKYLGEMASKSYATTRRRFGNVMQLYVPLYLANICQNHCVYCGFNCTNKIHRAILTPEEIHAEAQAIKRDPFQHILLVTGEAPRSSSVQYLADSMKIMQRYFEQISIEVQPLDTDEYRLLKDYGLHAVYVYQETYNRDRYPVYHLRGKKTNYRYRLETPDRLCEAGVHKVGLGNLIGLEDWRTEAYFTALHLRYLENRYWRTKYSVAFPRLRPYVGEDGFNPEHPASERNLFQLICAYRLLSEDVELSISTRESADFRDRVMPFGVTVISAGSKTTPGGYAHPNRELEQWSINDNRTPREVEAAVRAKGLDPVWKDWSFFMQEEVETPALLTHSA